ncbi:hypothetical protein BHM03_00016933 [Ensete ventricosum]|nr:hypothetical protein BHM03_00016933 [Ensete ventricosum]
MVWYPVPNERCCGRTRRRLILPHEEKRWCFVSRGEMRQRLIPAQGRSHRLVQHEEGGIASSLRWETPVPMVPPDSGRSAYQYPVGPVHTTHTRRYSSKLKTLLICIKYKVLPIKSPDKTQKSMCC